MWCEGGSCNSEVLPDSALVICRQVTYESINIAKQFNLINAIVLKFHFSIKISVYYRLISKLIIN